MQIKCLFKMLLLAATAAACSPSHTTLLELNEDSIKNTLQRTSTAFASKNMQDLQACLAADFSISIASMPAAVRYLEPMMENGAISTIELASVDSATTNMVFVTLNINGMLGSSKSTAAFDSSTKILFMDYMDRCYGHSRYKQSHTAAVLPFTMDSGGMVVGVKINNSNTLLRMLFDTGADGMAVSKHVADSLGLVKTGIHDAGFVGGRMQTAVSAGNTIYLTDSFSLKNQNIVIAEQIRHDVDGIIGLNLAANHVLSVDFDRQEIVLSSFGQYATNSEAVSIPISVPYGAALVPCILNLTGKNSVTGKFVFDTGAAYWFVGFSGFVRSHRLLLSGFKYEEEKATQSMGHSSVIYCGRAHSLTLSPEVLHTDIPIALQAGSSKHEDERSPDGSVGLGIISQYNFTLDLLQKKVLLLKRK